MRYNTISGEEVRAALRSDLRSSLGRDPSDREVEDAFAVAFAKNRRAISDGRDVRRIDDSPVSTVTGGTQGDYSRPGRAEEGDSFNIDATQPYALPAKMVSSGISGLTSGQVNMGGEDAAPSNKFETFMTGTSGALGVAGQMGIAAPALGAVALPGRLAALTPLARGAAGFGLYEGLAPAENLGERIGNVGHGVAMGSALGAAGAVPGLREITRGPLGRYLFDTSVMTGMGLHEGQDFGDALAGGAGAALGFGLSHGMGSLGAIDPRRSAYEVADRYREAQAAQEANKAARERAKAEMEQREAAASEARRRAAEDEAYRQAEAERLAQDGYDIVAAERAAEARAERDRIAGEEAAAIPERMADGLEGRPIPRHEVQYAEYMPPEHTGVFDPVAGRYVDAPARPERGVPTPSDPDLYFDTYYPEARREPRIVGLSPAEAAARRQAKADADARSADIADTMDLPRQSGRRAGGGTSVRPEGYTDRTPYAPRQEAAPARQSDVSGSARDYYDTVSPSGEIVPGATPGEGRVLMRNASRGGGDTYIGMGLGGGQGVLRDLGASLRAAGRAIRRPLGANMDADLRSGLGEVLAIDGVPVSRILADHANGRATTDQVVEWIKNNPDQIHGAVSEKGIADMTAEIKAFNKNVRDENKRIKQENKERVKRGEKPKPLLKPRKATKDAIYKAVLDKSIDAEMSGYANSGDVPGITANAFTDPRRLNQAMDRGEISGTIANRNKRLAEIAERFEVDVANEIAARAGGIFDRGGISRGSAESEAIWWILEGVNKSGGSMSIDEVAIRDPKAGAALDKTANPAEVVQAAKELADLFEWSWNTRDTVRKSLFGRGLGKREGYVPHVEKSWSVFSGEGGIKGIPYRVGRKIEKATRPHIKEVSGDRVRYSPDEALSSRQRERTGKLTEDMLEKDVVKLMENYASDTAGVLSNGLLVASSKGTTRSLEVTAKEFRKSARELRKEAADPNAADPDALIAEAERLTTSAKNMETTAKALDEINQFIYNGIGFGTLGKMSASIQQRRLGVAAYKLAAANKRMFNLARYTVNVPFMTLRQWTSLGLLGFFPEITAKDMLAAIVEGASPQAGELYRNTYTGWAKNLDVGRMYSEGGQGAVSRNVKIGKGQGSKMFDSALEGISKPTNSVEAMTGRISVALGTRIADKLGLTGKVRQDFLSDIVAKTQSEYHRSSRAPVLSDAMINSLAPAQSFSVESLNGVREVVNDKVGAKFYDTGREKAAALARAGFMTAIANLAYQYFNRTDELDELGFYTSGAVQNASSFVPYSSMFTGDGPSEGKLYSASMIDSGQKIASYISDGNWERAGIEATKMFVPAGGQLSRYQMANVMYERGIISSDELKRARVYGWWTTDGGRKYLRQFDGKKNNEAPQQDAPYQGRGGGGRSRGGSGRERGGRGRG